MTFVKPRTRRTNRF